MRAAAPSPSFLAALASLVLAGACFEEPAPDAGTAAVAEADGGEDDAGGGPLEDGGPRDSGPLDAGPLDDGLPADDGGLGDAGDGPDASTPPNDAGGSQCTEDLFDCRRNIDCAAGRVCEKEADAEFGCCVEPPCVRTLCLNGVGARDQGANSILETACYFPHDTIEDCSGGTCFKTFAWDDAAAGLEALIDALDTDGDNDVDDDDTQCEVVLAGYSWGGLNAVEVAADFLSDSRVAAARRQVRDLVVIDAFKVGAGDTYTVPGGVSRLWSYRHSIEPQGGCTQSLPFGPYLGRTPLCPASAACLDYDFSLEPEQEFGSSGITAMYLGADIDHCNVMEVALGNVIRNLSGASGTDNLPEPVAVAAP